MQTHQELTHFAGFDWAKDHHDVIIIDAKGGIVADFRIEHTPSGWKLWRERIAAWPKLGVAIETSFGAAVEQLMESGIAVYPVNPMNAKRYRERKCSSGNKTDRHDAWALADALRMDGHAWRTLSAQDPVIAELRILCREEVALIEERTALITSCSRRCKSITRLLLKPSMTGRCLVPGLSSRPSPAPRFSPRPADANGRGSCTATGSTARKPMRHASALLHRPLNGRPARPWWPPRACMRWPNANNCGCFKASSMSIAHASKRSLPAILTAACLVRCQGPE